MNGARAGRSDEPAVSFAQYRVDSIRMKRRASKTKDLKGLRGWYTMHGARNWYRVESKDAKVSLWLNCGLDSFSMDSGMMLERH